MAEKKQHEDKEKTVVVYELGFHLVPSLGEDDLPRVERIIADVNALVLRDR